jgi:hypothetical protein
MKLEILASELTPKPGAYKDNSDESMVILKQHSIDRIDEILKSYPHLGKNREEVMANMRRRDEMRKRIPSAIYRLEIKIDKKQLLKELTALEAIDKELKEVNKEIQVNNNFGKSFSTKKRNRNEWSPMLRKW